MCAEQTSSRNAVLASPEYDFRDVATLDAPRLLVFRALVERNVDRMREYLEEVAPGTGFRHLCTHVKTHKSAWVTQQSLERGMTDFKCSLNELDMLLEAKVPQVFIAYPLLPPEAERVARAIREFPATRITVQVARGFHADALAAAAARHQVEFDVLLDLDVGGHRTGLPPAEALELARRLTAEARYQSLHLRGLHAYDGHNSSSEQAERDAVAAATAEATVACERQLAAAGIPIERIITAGSPGFRRLLHELLHTQKTEAEVRVSPGTWVFWDSNYDGRMPGLFSIAAVLFGRVMDRPSGDLVTLNLGHKRWSIDQGPPQYFSVPGLEYVAATEEHTVLRAHGDAARALDFNDPVLFAPRHVCPTINLWDRFTLIGPDGSVEGEQEVTARNR